MTDTLTPHEFAPMLNPDDVAKVLKISRRHLDDTRHEDASFPAPRMLGTLPRWSYDTIRAWVDAPAHSTSLATPITPPAKKGANRVH